MKPPAREIRLILSAPGMGWEYIVRQHGEAIAASDGDAHYPHMGAALAACAAEIKAGLARRENEREASEAAENGE